MFTNRTYRVAMGATPAYSPVARLADGDGTGPGNPDTSRVLGERARYTHRMVGIIERVVVILVLVATLLGTTAAGLPEGVPTTVPPMCVKLLGGLQAGYCP
jgi:hypothetical protein